MLDSDSFEEFKDPETYDLLCDAWAEDYPFIEEWARKTGGPLLDIGCGTGRMSIHMALLGYEVSGVDIVPEMIAKAKGKAAAQNVKVDFSVGDARNFHLNKQFPLAFMLMNAFQFLPAREDHEGLFACVREHLLPDGYFIFETRNPNPRNLFELRMPEGERSTAPDGTRIEVISQQQYDPMTQLQHYTSRYTFTRPDGQVEERTLHTGLRYVFPQEMEALLHYNGLRIHAAYGSWQGEPLVAESRAMIYVCQKRS